MNAGLLVVIANGRCCVDALFEQLVPCQRKRGQQMKKRHAFNNTRRQRGLKRRLPWPHLRPSQSAGPALFNEPRQNRHHVNRVHWAEKEGAVAGRAERFADQLNREDDDANVLDPAKRRGHPCGWRRDVQRGQLCGCCGGNVFLLTRQTRIAC